MPEARRQVRDDLVVLAHVAAAAAIAWLVSWTRRSVLEIVPSFSAKETPGRTTSASRAVSVRKMSWTTRRSSLREALLDVVQVGVGDHRVLAQDVQGADLLAAGRDHLGEGHARPCRTAAPFQYLENFSTAAGLVTGW